jgi:hypothetical protein
MSSNLKQSWTCQECTFDNSEIHSPACGVCDCPNPLQFWTCIACSFQNSDQNCQSCNVCNCPRTLVNKPARDAALTGELPAHLRSLRDIVVGALSMEQRNKDILKSFGLDPTQYTFNIGPGFGVGIVDELKSEEIDFDSHIRQKHEAKAATRCDASRQLPPELVPVALPLLAQHYAPARAKGLHNNICRAITIARHFARLKEMSLHSYLRIFEIEGCRVRVKVRNDPPPSAPFFFIVGCCCCCCCR